MLDQNVKAMTEETKKARAGLLRQEISRIEENIKMTEIFQTLKTNREWNIFMNILTARNRVLSQERDSLDEIDYSNYDNNKARLLRRANKEGRLSELKYLINLGDKTNEENRKYIEKKGKLEAELKVLIK